MLKFIDNILNRVTMYRLVLYYLASLLAFSFFFSWIHWLSFSPRELLVSSLIILAVSIAANIVCARVFEAPANVESVYITALILALIITPPSFASFSASFPMLVWAPIWAIASKFLLAVKRKHIFNPAAFGVAVTALTINSPATWWVGGNLALLPLVVLGGILIVRKLRRSDLVIAFFIVALATITILPTLSLSSIKNAVLHTPIFFFAFVMLTEPLTTPPTKPRRIAYGSLVGFLFAPVIHIASLYSTPELALLAGNVFSYLVSPKRKYLLRLASVRRLSADTYDFAFAGELPKSFRPGQYLEWTLPHRHPDSRGNRRYFTIASAPEDKRLHLGTKFYQRSSSFKKALSAMAKGDTLLAGQLSGDFVLPRDTRRKLVFIAGGIGITPFVSILRHLAQQGEERSIVLLYSCRTENDIAYRDEIDQVADQSGIKARYILTESAATANNKRAMPGPIDAEVIRREIPDFQERLFYLSGPHGMVEAFTGMLAAMGIRRRNIKTDFFPGFA